MSISIQTDSNQLDGDDGDNGFKSAGRWTQEEHNVFLQGLQTHQKQWKLIADMVKTRTVVQIRTHAQKYFQKLHKANGGTGGWKYDKDDGYLDHDLPPGRSYANPVADSRANSFCSSGDSVDGTSAEGVDSEGETGHRLVGMNVPKKPSGAVRSNSHGYDFAASSGSTSNTNSALSSPNGSTANVFANTTKRAPAQPKAKGELVRKRSRESMKSSAQGAAAPSPKKQDNSFLKSKSGEMEPTGRYYPGISTTGSTQPYYSSVGYPGASGYSGGGYGVTGVQMPGPLPLPQEDLRMGLGLDLVPDFLFPSSGFPEDPCASYIRTTSNDTDLTNHTPQYFSSAFGPGYNPSEHDHDDDGLMHLLDKIDWDDDVAHSTTDNSRPLSPITDTASSIGSHPISTSGRVHLNNPVVPFALAMSKVCEHSPVADTGAHPSAATSTESVSSEISRLSAECPVPGSPASEVMRASIATGIAMGAAATAQEDDLQPQHRLAFSSVINELKLVTKVAKFNGNNGIPVDDDSEADHISLFDLFQRDGALSVGRLPPLRSLVQHALARGAITAVSAPMPPLKSSSAPVLPSAVSKTDGTSAASGMEFDDHEFDFSSFMNDDFHYESQQGGFDNQVMQMQFMNAPEVGSVDGSAPHLSHLLQQAKQEPVDLFAGEPSILDASGALTSAALLNNSMMPSSAPGSKTATPNMTQRKRGRPRKYSISVPAAPASTPSATSTAKSLLSGPALAHALSTQQYQHQAFQQQTDAQQYVVPINATVLQAYNLAVSQSGAVPGTSLSDYRNNSRSFSGDHSHSSSYASLRHSPNGADPLGGLGGPHYHPGSSPDIRLGLTRTMSSESDTMMANCFDPKLYDDIGYGMGMLEDFE